MLNAARKAHRYFLNESVTNLIDELAHKTKIIVKNVLVPFDHTYVEFDSDEGALAVLTDSGVTYFMTTHKDLGVKVMLARYMWATDTIELPEDEKHVEFIGRTLRPVIRVMLLFFMMLQYPQSLSIDLRPAYGTMYRNKRIAIPETKIIAISLNQRTELKRLLFRTPRAEPRNHDVARHWRRFRTATNCARKWKGHFRLSDLAHTWIDVESEDDFHRQRCIVCETRRTEIPPFKRGKGARIKSDHEIIN